MLGVMPMQWYVNLVTIAAAGVLGWIVLEFLTKPIRAFFALRDRVRAQLLLLANVAPPKPRETISTSLEIQQCGASPARHFDGKARQPSQSESSRLQRTGNPDQSGKRICPDRAAVIRAIQAAGTTSFASVADVLNERGIKSARGGKWHVSSVANVLAGRQANLAIAFL